MLAHRRGSFPHSLTKFFRLFWEGYANHRSSEAATHIYIYNYIYSNLVYTYINTYTNSMILILMLYLDLVNMQPETTMVWRDPKIYKAFLWMFPLSNSGNDAMRQKTSFGYASTWGIHDIGWLIKYATNLGPQFVAHTHLKAWIIMGFKQMGDVPPTWSHSRSC
jgi:hypothetical protein